LRSYWRGYWVLFGIYVLMWLTDAVETGVWFGKVVVTGVVVLVSLAVLGRWRYR